MSPGSIQPDVIEETYVSEPVPPVLSRWKRIKQYLGAVVVPLLTTRLMLVLIGIVTVFYILPLINTHQPIYPNPLIKHFPDTLYFMWDHFDAGFYMGIAQGGYWPASTLKGMSNWAFFPLYPLLIRIVALVVGTTHYNAYRISGLFVSFVATLIAGAYLYRLTKLECTEKVARRAVWLLAVFPTSFYLTAIYPESLALALSIACLYYARKRAWGLAGIFGGLASLAHPQGVLLVVVVAYELWQSLSEQVAPLASVTRWQKRISTWCYSRFVGVWAALRHWRTWAALVALCIIPLGIGLFCLYGYLKTGTFTPFTVTEHNGWGRQYINPVLLISGMIEHPRPASPYDWNFYGLNMDMLFFGFLMLIPIFRKLPFSYGLFTLLNVLLPITAGETNSVARFTLGIFPIYIVLALWSCRGSDTQQEQRFGVLQVVSALLLALCMAMFTLGIYSMS